MKKAEVIEIIRQHAEEIRARGATALYLFGSTVRGEAGEGSDVDIFIDYDRSAKFSLLDLIGLEFYLEDLLGAKADVTTRSSLHPRLKDRIVAEAEQVF